MNNKRVVITPLAGGLGNQLFQLAHALSDSQNSEILLEGTIFTPRCNLVGEPEILDFKLPGEVRVNTENGVTIKFARKFSSILLRIGSSDSPKVIKYFAFLLLSPVTSFFIRLETGIWARVVVSKNVGFSNVKKNKKSVTYLGYFQSYKWMENNPDALVQMKSLELRNSSLLLDTLIGNSKNLNILGIHVRLGDYKFESKIGLLSPQYYKNALTVLNPKNYDEIWIFTNDEEESKSVLTDLHEVKKVWIPGTLTSAETLHLMTFCNDFVISNSTFSWWGAFLNRNAARKIVCPDVWFQKMSDPVDICPEEWIRVKSFSTESILEDKLP